MNRGPADEFESKVDGLLRSVHAGRRRLRLMREELLAHLWQAFEEERSQGADDAHALQAAITRFGGADELRDQLERSVPPLERWFARLFFDPKEIAMSIGPRFAGWVMCLVGGAFMLGLGVVVPAVAKLAELTSLSASPAQLLDIEKLLKGSLVSLVILAFAVTFAGLSILAHAFFTRGRTAR